METAIKKISSGGIADLRALFLQENKFQFVHNKCHENNWADNYLFLVDGNEAGYGSVWGKNKREDRDTIFEFYLLSPYRKFSHLLFSKLIATAKTSLLECQTNDLLLSSMFFLYAKNITVDSILFEEAFESHMKMGDVIFCKNPEASNFDQQFEYVLKQNELIVATGGFLLNYNFPYADIYMEVKEGERNKGFGSLIVQEIKKEIYKIGRVPGARCNPANQISMKTLLKAGFRSCGALLSGELR